MTLPLSGTISSSNVRTELTETGQFNLDKASARSLSGIASGTIKLSDFYGKTFVFDYGSTWTYQPNFSTTLGNDYENIVRWCESEFISANANNGGLGLLKSTDGVTWTTNAGFFTIWGSTKVNDIFWNGSVCCVVGDSGKIATSTDRSTWTLRTSNTTASLSQVIYDGSRFIAVGATGRMTVSVDNGVTWALQASYTTAVSTAFSALTITYNGSMYVVTGSTSGPQYKCYTSPNLVTWTLRSTFNTVFTSRACTTVVWNGTQFLAAGASHKCATSPDGITWTAQTGLSTCFSPTLYDWYDSVWIGDRYFIVGSSGRGASSFDGLTWTSSSTLPAVVGNKVINSITWSGTKLLAVGYYGCCATSP